MTLKNIYRVPLASLLFVLVACSGNDSESTNDELEYSVGNAILYSPAEFSILEGPFDPDPVDYNSQSLLIIVTDENTIICQVTYEPLIEDIGRERAFEQITANSVGASYISTDSIQVNSVPADEGVTSYFEPDGTAGTAIFRSYYFSAQEVPGDLSYLHTIQCNTATVNFSVTEPTMRRVLDSVRWAF